MEPMIKMTKSNLRCGGHTSCKHSLFVACTLCYFVTNTHLKWLEHYSTPWLCSILYVAFDMGIHHLTFMERNLENKKRSGV